MVTMRLELEEGMHRRLKLWAFENGWTMVSAVRKLIGDAVGDDERDAAIHHEVARKQPKASAAGTPPVAKPSMDDLDSGEAITGKCSKCMDNFLATALISYPQFPNKKFCPGCVENMKNGQG